MTDYIDDEKFVANRRIRYADDEEVAGGRDLRLARQLSQGSMSIHTAYSTTSRRSRRGSIDPANTLPIQYKTLSFQLSESKGKDIVEVKRAKDAAATELADLDWHIITPSELYTRLSTSLQQGLSTDQVTRRFQEYGKNIPSKPPSHLFKDIFGYLFGGFGSILLIGSILVFISWKPLGHPAAVANLALAIVLMAVFIIQAAFNAWQDWSSSQVMNSITGMLPENCIVRRDGVQAEVVATELVPGDVIHIKSGNKLPADVRFVEVSSDAKFDRAILTGESLPVPGSTDSTDDNYLETHCIGLQGTHCISGSGLGVVVSTGDKTVFGKISQLTNKPNTTPTTLQVEIRRFVTIIVSVAVAMIALVIILWAAWLRRAHPDWISVPGLIVVCVSVAISFVPEGLPISLTASLTITANLMRKNNILCKSLKTVETLGAVSVICSDKTGTLTKNQMFVTECSFHLQKLSPETARDEMIKREHMSTDSASNNPISQLRFIAGLCNAGEFDAASSHLPLHERKINGDATDQAVLRFSESFGPVAQLRQYWKKDFELAFNSKNKFMIRTLSLVEEVGLSVALPAKEADSFTSDDVLLTIKGAPDVLIGRCDFLVGEDGTTVNLDASTRQSLEEIKNKWSSEGKRVILLARKVLAKGSLHFEPSTSEYEREVTDYATSGLTLVGLVGIVDPPRDEIPEVVRILRRAGIRVLMVTGDFALTAQAIAQECGIITNLPHQVDNISALSRDVSTVNSDKPAFKENTSENTSEDMGIKSIVLSGPELITLNENQWNQLCQYTEIVFARTTPEQKLRIVKEFQARDNIVGMTGDGVNDAPSLKAADIGIALGSGSDIAIEASDMVLLDSFSAIVEAVLYGRVVFDNLKKTISYLIPAGCFGELWPVLTNVLFGLPQILSSFLMIMICCLTDCAAATTLAYEKPESDVMLRPPRNPKKQKLVDWRLIVQAYGVTGVLETLTSFAMSYWYLERRGIPFSAMFLKFGKYPAHLDPAYITRSLNEASSIYFVNLVIMQMFNLMAVRTRRLSILQQPPAFNKYTQNLSLFPAILFALLIAFFWLYIEPLQKALGTTQVPVEHWFLPVAFGMGLLLFDEGRKWVVRNYPNSFVAKAAW